MRLSQYECFIIKNTGDTVFGNKLKGPDIGKAYDNNNSNDIKLDGNVYSRYEVKNLQDKYAYYSIIWNVNILGNRVPHFVKLVLKGKINLYYVGEETKESSGKKIDVFAFQKGNTAEIKELNKDEIVTLLEDNKEAQEKFIQYFKPERKNRNVISLDFKRIMEVVNIYNGN
ncbi:MAG: hypothetical protein ABUL44_01310 [Flavobacterium sp.]